MHACMHGSYTAPWTLWATHVDSQICVAVDCFVLGRACVQLLLMAISILAITVNQSFSRSVGVHSENSRQPLAILSRSVSRLTSEAHRKYVRAITVFFAVL